MSDHVDLLGVLFIVWGLLTALIGVSTLALGVGAFALVSSATRGGNMAAGLTALFFTVLACIAMIWGTLHVMIGVALRRRRHWARLLALVAGSVDLLLLPYGTALGCYALWVLLHDEGRRLFATV